MKFKTFFLQRILAWALTILIGVTFIFFIPRMFPSDPVENMIAQMQSRSGNMDPAEMEALRQQLRIHSVSMALFLSSMATSCCMAFYSLTLARL